MKSRSKISQYFSSISDRITDRLGVLLAPLREQLATSIDRLQPRERVIVAIGAVAVALTVLYSGIWHPASKARIEAESRLTDARAIAVQLERAGAMARANPGAHPQGGGGSLLTIVDQATRAGDLGKTPPRLQPDGENAVRVWFENVPFDNLARWMGQLETKYGVRIDAVDVEHQSTPGVVNARLSIGRGA
jgi:general secretion pathway protein M